MQMKVELMATTAIVTARAKTAKNSNKILPLLGLGKRKVM
jgi:hypothetical protein